MGFNMKKIIWIIGSNASGKSTQSRLLHELFKTKPQQNFNEDNYIKYSTFGKSAHVGTMTSNQCCGTDTLQTKDQIESTFLTCMLIEEVEFILIDGVMGTGMWLDMLTQFPVHLTIVYLHFETCEQNFERVRLRRFKKTGLDQELSDKTKANVASKTKGFLSLYNRTKDSADVHIKIDATLPIEVIFNKIKSIL